MHFDATISIGNVITFAGIVVAWYSLQFNTKSRESTMHTSNENRLTAIETNTKSMDDRLKRIEGWLFSKIG